MESPDDLTFSRVTIDGKPWWLASNGRLAPVIRGGADDGGDEDEGDDDSTGDGRDAGTDDKGDKPAFDPERARADISKKNRENASLRARLKELEPLAGKLKELEDKDKSELERTQADRDKHKAEHESTRGALLRIEVALEKAPEGMPLAKVRQLAKRLTGNTQEELEADAEELFGEFASQEDKSQEDKHEVRKGGSRPKEKLRSGAIPNAEVVEMDPDKLADQVPRRW